MKKLIAAIMIIAFSTSVVKAQESTFNLGDKVVNVGIGLGSTLYTGSYYSTVFPPVSASFEYGVKDGILDKGVIGVGGYIGYASSKYESTYYNYSTGRYEDYGWKYSNLIIGARGAFHYPLINKFDTYTGLMLGYDIVTDSEIGDFHYGTPTSYSGFIWSWYIGGRYWFNEKIAGMVELGYGIAYLNLGVAFKL
jgi:hypothetical protein